MYSPTRSPLSPQQPAVADNAGDGALAALDRLLDLDRVPDSQATVIVHGMEIPPEAKRPDDEPTVMMVGPARVLVGLEAAAIETPPPSTVRFTQPRAVVPAPRPTLRPRAVTPASVVPLRPASPVRANEDAKARWIVAAIWAAALGAFLVLAALMTAAEKNAERGAPHLTTFISNR